MTDDSVRELLKKVHDTLSDTNMPPATAEDRRLLEQLADDIQALLAPPGGQESGGQESLADRLRSAITRFEVSHPDLTATMSRAAKTLGDMGI